MRVSVSDVAKGTPFLKWAGGKSQLLPAYESLFPPVPDLATYHEPFLGSGAVFFHLRRAGSVLGRAVLSDLNPHLVTTWSMVRDEPVALASRIAELGAVHSDDEYYRQRARFNEEALPPLERAAVMLYLNKTGFNGLYRENAKGRFNVPVGRSSSGALSLPSAASLEGCSRALRGAEILRAPFATVLDRARAGDFVYFDPPYVPISPTASFTAYSCDGFGMAEQELLRDVFVQLHERGCLVMLSNSASFEVRKLYDGFDVMEVAARRSINSRIDARGPVNEVVIRNYRAV